VDAMTGQEAATLTAAFDAAVGITGAVLTKMDGDSRGGAAVSVRGVSGKPIKFVGTGEKINDLEPFYPDRMASRILGMGDVVSLVEKAAAEVSDAEAAKMTKKMLEQKFDFDDYMQQSKMLSNMGSLAGVAKMLPGLGKNIDSSQLADTERRIKRSESMINSMSKKERANPDLLITDRSARSRAQRIARGAGLQLSDAVAFVSEFQKMRTMMSRMQKQMGGQNPMDMSEEDQQLAMAGGPQGQATNRLARRKAKKNKGGKKGGGMGFGG
jgi:signal recognition particle subunit SRP54